MKRKNLLAVVALLSTLGALATAERTEAFVYTTCNGNPIVWSGPFFVLQNLGSISSGGSREKAVDNAIGRWNGIIGMTDMVIKFPGGSGGTTITTGDGVNDVAVAPRANIGGNNGLTLLTYSLCVFESSWGEADIFAASDLSYATVQQDVLVSNSGRSTFMHEFGHAVGLDHHQLFNNMRTPQPRGVVGGTGETIDALPDDAAGGRFLYPTGNDEINLFATAQRLKTSTDQILMNHTGAVAFCSSGGQSITLNSTVGNNGTKNVTQNERWWVSTSSNAFKFTDGIQIFGWNNSTFKANKVLTRQVTFDMPALPVGSYFLFHGVDAKKEVDESREDDNVVREGLKINIVNC